MFELLGESQRVIDELTARLAERDAQIAALQEKILRLDVLVARLEEKQDESHTTNIQPGA